MRRIEWAACLVILVVLGGCQTDRKGVGINITKAVDAYKQTLDRKPSRAQMERLVASLSAEQLNDMGVLYEREGKLDRAAWAYQQSIWRNPRFAIAYVNLGNVLRTQGQTEEALHRYRQAMNADRKSFDAANNFADLCAEKGVHLDEAVGRLKPRLATAGAHRAYGLDTLGWLYHLTGDNAKAVETLQSGLADPGAKDPTLRSMIHQHLAVVYQGMGKPAEAASQQAEAARIEKHP